MSYLLTEDYMYPCNYKIWPGNITYQYCGGVLELYTQHVTHTSESTVLFISRSKCSCRHFHDINVEPTKTTVHNNFIYTDVCKTYFKGLFGAKLRPKVIDVIELLNSPSTCKQAIVSEANQLESLYWRHLLEFIRIRPLFWDTVMYAVNIVCKKEYWKMTTLVISIM